MPSEKYNGMIRARAWGLDLVYGGGDERMRECRKATPKKTMGEGGKA